MDTADVAPSRTGSPSRGGPRSLARGLHLLDLVATAPDGLSVTELAGTAGLDKGTTSRLLATLRAAGLVRQRAGDRKYLVGGRVAWLAQAYSVHRDLREAAPAHLAALRVRTNETVHLAVWEGGADIVYVEHLPPDREVHTSSALGSTMPLHRTAMGHAILAALPVAGYERLTAQLYEDGAAWSGVDLTHLARAVDSARGAGWASLDRGDDVTRVAAAVIGATGVPVGAVSVSGPTYRMGTEIPAMGEHCRTTAREISRDLGAGVQGRSI